MAQFCGLRMGGHYVAHRFNRLYFCNADVFYRAVSARLGAGVDLFGVLDGVAYAFFGVGGVDSAAQ